jgi:hypothetical protein
VQRTALKALHLENHLSTSQCSSLERFLEQCGQLVAKKAYHLSSGWHVA